MVSRGRGSIVGIFGPSEKINITEPGVIDIPESVAQHIPDVGEYFLDWVGHPGRDRLVSVVNALRGSNGWIATQQLHKYGSGKHALGPLTFLQSMIVRGNIAMSVWASYPLRGADKRAIENTVTRLVDQQGHAAAAMWAIATRPAGRLDLDDLAGSLTSAWDEGVSWVRHIDLIRAFKKWRP
jgi:hypothetical protein